MVELAQPLQGCMPPGSLMIQSSRRQPMPASILMALSGLLHPLTALGNSCRWQELLGGQAEKPKVPKGLYIYGGVGTGKTMLMDLFAEVAPPEFQVCLLAPHPI